MTINKVLSSDSVVMSNLRGGRVHHIDPANKLFSLIQLATLEVSMS